MKSRFTIARRMLRPDRRMTSTLAPFALMMILVEALAHAQPIPPPRSFVARGFQLSSSSPLMLYGDPIGDNAVWQPLASPILGSTLETIPSGPGFGGAVCRQEFRQGQILTQDGSSLTVHTYGTRCDPAIPSGTPAASLSTASTTFIDHCASHGIYSIQGGTGTFADVIGGTGSVQFLLNSDGMVFLSIDGTIQKKVYIQAAADGEIQGRKFQQAWERPPFAPYLPTPREVVDAMLKLADVKANDVVYDLGSGDGRIVIAAAEQYAAHSVGIDLDPKLVEAAAANARQSKVEKLVEFRQQDLFKADISKATVVTLYLLPEVTRELRQKLLRELKPGTRIVSHSFDLGDWKPDKQEIIRGRAIYLWTVPEHRARQKADE